MPSWGGAFLSIVSYFVRQIVCSPVRLFRVLWRMSTNISEQFSVMQLLRNRAVASYVCANPKFLFKYLPPRYLIRNMSAPTRTTCFLHHYKYLLSQLSDNSLRTILREDVTVFQLQDGEHRFEITMGRSRDIRHSRHVDHEGELSLNLLVDHSHVYVLSFTIVPGWVVGSQTVDVLMITRIQGALGVFPKISQASKAMRGMPADMILMTALRGVAEAFGIREMAGVSAARHLCYCEDDDAIFKKSYDEFFLRVGAARNSADFFIALFPLPEKPLSQVKRGQKTRARARRAFKEQMAMETFGYFRLHGSTAAERSLCYAFDLHDPEGSDDGDSRVARE